MRLIRPKSHQALLNEHQRDLNNGDFALQIATGLKQASDDAMRTSAERARQLTELGFSVAEMAGSESCRALALRARGNIAHYGSNDCRAAVADWQAASDIYLALGDEEAWAMTQTGIVVCLGYLGQLDKSVAIAARAQPILEATGQGQSLFGLLMNMSVLHSRRGMMSGALEFLEQSAAVADHFSLTQFAGELALNRSFILRNMGRLQEAVEAANSAETIFTERDAPVYIAHAQLSRALTFIALGRYNEALALFDLARDAYVAAQHQVDAVWIDLFATNCWLQLGRYSDVLRLAAAARTQFASLGLRRDMAEAILNEAVAYAALNRFDEARQSFDEAHAIFSEVQNPGDATFCQLELAAVLMRRGDSQEAGEIAQRCYRRFLELQQTLRATQAQLISAEATFASGERENALVLLDSAENAAESEMALWLVYQAQSLRGRVLRDSADVSAALSSYRNAIDTLERLRGRLMTEFRADFLRDKESVYAEAVDLCLDKQDATQALEIVERARSRALIDLIAHRLDLRIAPRSQADRELVEQLQAQQEQRNALYRRWMDGECADIDETRRQIAALEAAVTQGWHRLMVRNADYARDAAMTSVRSEPIQPYLSAETLLIEFFTNGDDIVMFLVSAETLHAHRIAASQRRVASLIRKLNINFKAASVAPEQRIGRLIAAAQQILQQLHKLLFEPVAETIAAYRQLILVPHGAALHYLPFHALHDGRRYLCESHQISYLPSASLLHYLHANRQPAAAETTDLAIGYSNNDALPHAVEEAGRVATQIGGDALVEDAATLLAVQEHGGQARLLHLSTHGDFNQGQSAFLWTVVG